MFPQEQSSEDDNNNSITDLNPSKKAQPSVVQPGNLPQINITNTYNDICQNSDKPNTKEELIQSNTQASTTKHDNDTLQIGNENLPYPENSNNNIFLQMPSDRTNTTYSSNIVKINSPSLGTMPSLDMNIGLENFPVNAKVQT